MFPLHVYVAALLFFTHHCYSQQLGESCVIEQTNTPGVCSPASSCQSARRDYEINGIFPTLCRKSSSTLLTVVICCSNESSLLNTASNYNRERSNNAQTNRDNKRLSEKKCEEFSSQIQIVSYFPLLPDHESISISVPNCDYNGVELNEKMYAEDREFPHLASIGWTNSEGTYSFLCVGSLISTKFVLTAAHCTKYSKMKDPNPVIVRLGDQNLDPTKNDNASSIEVPIKNITRHPEYKSPGKNHDIALLELVSDIDFNMEIRPACLWYRYEVPGYSQAVAVGWGVEDLHTRSPSDNLQRFSLSLITNDQCIDLLRTTKSWFRMDQLTNNQICVTDLRGEKE